MSCLPSSAVIRVIGCLALTLVAVSYSQDWVMRYGPEAGATDIGRSIAVDASGAAYVAGVSRQGYQPCPCLLKYNSGGLLEWARPLPDTDLSTIHNDEDVMLSANESVIICDAASVDLDHRLRIWSYTPDGNRNWRTDWVHSMDHLITSTTALAEDVRGHIRAITTSWTETGNRNIAVWSLAPSGQEDWHRTYDGPTHSWDHAYGLAVDGSSSTYVVGKSLDSLLNYNLVVLKYDSSGTLLWEYRYASNSGLGSEGLCATTSNDGSVWISGNVQTDSGKCLFVHLNPNGDTMCTSTAPGHLKGAVAADSGRLIAVGSNCDSSAIRTWLIDPTGEAVWCRDWIGEGLGIRLARAVTRGYDGSVVLCGSTTTSQSGLDAITLKYTPSGTLLWAGPYNGPANQDDIGLAVSLSSADATYTTGSSEQSDGVPDMITMMFAPGGPSIDDVSGNVAGEPLVRVTPSVVANSCRIDVTRADQSVDFRVLDALGRLVRALDAQYPSGQTAVARWNLLDDRGIAVPDGAYFVFVTLENGRTQHAKLLVSH